MLDPLARGERDDHAFVAEDRVRAVSASPEAVMLTVRSSTLALSYGMQAIVLGDDRLEREVRRFGAEPGAQAGVR